MSKRSKEAVLQLFPIQMKLVPQFDGGIIEEDVNRWKRMFAKIGYEQAEKDMKDCLMEWAKERYQQTISNVGCYTGHSVWTEVIEKLESV